MGGIKGEHADQKTTTTADQMCSFWHGSVFSYERYILFSLISLIRPIFTQFFTFDGPPIRQKINLAFPRTLFDIFWQNL